MKWPIPDQPFDDTETQTYWENSHVKLDYSDVFSVTQDPALRARVSSLLRTELPAGPRRVLVPGCGSRALLERHLVDEFPQARVVATDLPPVIRHVRETVTHPRIDFVGRDTRDLQFSSEFDAAVVINSILSDRDSDNRRMLASVAASIREGGLFVGLFPTIFAAVDIANNPSGDGALMQLVDIPAARFYENLQKRSQIYYTPLRLRVALREAGFVGTRFEIFFCESEVMLEEGRRVYGLSDDDLTVYELLVTATARGAPHRPSSAAR